MITSKIAQLEEANLRFDHYDATSGSVFANKYSEGYIGRRYYGGQQFTERRGRAQRTAERSPRVRRRRGLQRRAVRLREDRQLPRSEVNPS